jgi:type III restriction enzyme
MHLYERIQQQVTQWRADGYPCPEYPAIGEIFDYATIQLPDERQQLRFLRVAQLRALETYWYLRLVEGTPHIFDLYQKTYTRTTDLLAALGMDSEAIRGFVLDEGQEALWQQVRAGGHFVKSHKLETVHETITLDYPSYIFALAMGAGKTILIGAIIATEFAMALEYHPSDDGPFIQNALVFAPGLTILESLRELVEIDYSQLIPPRLYRSFDASYKITFTQDGQKDLPLIRGSRYNLVVTNTEKIRIQKRAYRHHTWTQLEYEHKQEQYAAEANLRLQAIASLPNLGIFSDEAHHTYGTEVGKSLKRVRQTVDYLHEKTNLIAVINTTGTPYYERQPLRDVVIWYGLSQGIEDDILKSLENNIFAYDFVRTEQFIHEIVSDFFRDYGEVTLPDGSPAKIAIYFPSNNDLAEMRPAVEQALLAHGHPPDIVLRNTERSTAAEIDAFNRLNDPRSRHRVILLVNKGTEGWNCPSLFACALARKLTSSNNFVLQASTRCLRQVPGNSHKARIYLSMENRGVLDQQLQETYGETIDHLTRTKQNSRSRRLVLRKTEIPPLVVRQLRKKIVPQAQNGEQVIQLQKPSAPAETFLVRRTFTPGAQPGKQSVLAQTDEESIQTAVSGSDLYTAATRLAAIYRQPLWPIYHQLKQLYADGIVPDTHLPELAQQIEAQTQQYTVTEEEVEVALALVRPEGFNREEENGRIVYTTEITYHVDKEDLLLSYDALLASGPDPGRFGFHYDPYNFDSRPERDFFTALLRQLHIQPDEVADIYFTGAISDPNKTDFFVEYTTTTGKVSRYMPDFIIRRHDGRVCIVEIKAERFRQDPVDGQNGRKALAVQKWVDLNPDLLKYEMIFSDNDTIPINAVRAQIWPFLTLDEAD